MKVLFVGLGSIASRHIKNLKALYGDGIEISVIRSGKGREIPTNISSMVNKIYTDRKALEKKYDCIFITNPTVFHYNTLLDMQPYGDAFFVEKPVFMAGDEEINIFDGKIYYVACPLRYTRVIQYLKKNISFSKVYAIRSICSSYLPEWRPGISYQDSYSAHKDMGGGVSADLIHEWDYLVYLFGFPDSLYRLISKKSNLEIDADDVALYLGEYKNKTIELHLDYFGRKQIRQLELFMENDTVRADLYSANVQWLCSGKIMDFSEDRDEYQQRELIHFFDIVNGKVENDNDLDMACKVLRLARGII